jgi:hypothetical protein
VELSIVLNLKRLCSCSGIAFLPLGDESIVLCEKSNYTARYPIYYCKRQTHKATNNGQEQMNANAGRTLSVVDREDRQSRMIPGPTSIQYMAPITQGAISCLIITHTHHGVQCKASSLKILSRIFAANMVTLVISNSAVQQGHLLECPMEMPFRRQSLPKMSPHGSMMVISPSQPPPECSPHFVREPQQIPHLSLSSGISSTGTTLRIGNSSSGQYA